MDFKPVLRQLPDKPGVYTMYDSRGHIIYIGKAKSLKKRVTQYFRKQKDRDPKIAEMMQAVASVTWVTTDTELEALVEECRLIREIKPRYNSKMKNTKGYVFIRVPNEPFPKLVTVTERVDDGSEYFGPFANAFRIELALGYLNDFFLLRKCSTQALVSKKAGCLFWQIGTCKGPCMGKLSSDEYKQGIDRLKSFLLGKDMGAYIEFKKKLDNAVEMMDYEQAALYYEYYIGLEHMVRRQSIAQSSNKRRNIVAFEYTGATSIKLFFIKGNRLLNSFLIDMVKTCEDGFRNEFTQLIRETFSSNVDLPELTQNDIDEAQIIYSYLRRNKERIPAFWVPATHLRNRSGDLEEHVGKIITRITSMGRH